MSQRFKFIIQKRDSAYVYIPDSELHEFAKMDSSVSQNLLKEFYNSAGKLSILGEFTTSEFAYTKFKSKEFEEVKSMDTPGILNSKAILPTGLVAVNFNKQSYVKLDGNEYNPLIMLCMLGNGLGIDEYTGSNYYNVSKWFGDMVSVVSEQEAAFKFRFRKEDVYFGYE